MTSRCRDCRYWPAPASEPLQVGECCRLAPRPAAKESHMECAPVFPIWPNTCETDWRGKFDLRADRKL